MFIDSHLLLTWSYSCATLAQAVRWVTIPPGRNNKGRQNRIFGRILGINLEQFHSGAERGNSVTVHIKRFDILRLDRHRLRN